MGDELILTRDPENLKAICVSQVNDYDFGTDRMAILELLIANGVLNNAGEAWKYSRVLLQPQFAREVVSDLEMEERQLNDVWPVVDREMAEDGWTGAVDLQSTLFSLTHPNLDRFSDRTQDQRAQWASCESRRQRYRSAFHERGL